MLFAPRIAFVDVETTGTSPMGCRVTEVGIVIVTQTEDEVVVDEWSSLVDPGVPIPPEIRFLTGITDAMLAGAPSFAQLAPQILERLEGAVFVAHQARFDYGFIRAELERAGHRFAARTLCTVRLSRLMDPDRAPHTLDAIIARYRLAVPDRHRALGDARALWQFVQALAQRHSPTALRQAASHLLQHPGLPAHLGADALAAVPPVPGVYAMLGLNDQPLYVGRSANLRRRIASHFSADPTRERAVRLASETHRIEWHQTAGELGARLLEGHWIRTRQPSHNIAQRRTRPVFVQIDEEPPRPRILAADRLAPAATAGLFGPFASRAGARAMLLQAADQAGLCLATLGLERRSPGQACFRHQLGRCAGACVGQRAPALEAQALRAAMTAHQMPAWPGGQPIALIEPAPDGTADWHVFWHWRHLGSVHDETAARELAARHRPRDAVAAAASGAPEPAPAPAIEPDVYRLLRTRLAAPAPAQGQFVEL
ncbi:MAG: GIY-YIG nuclease family protein [Burkholderiaceae bacterium]|nr:GIY-YIG nuclease family protein [Burkholderiaceae bacterium]